MTEDILSKAKNLLGGNGTYNRKQLPNAAASLAKASEVLGSKGSLDVYVWFDTTGSMDSYIQAVRRNIGEVTSALLDGTSDIRLSINGIGDYCDGDNLLQMYLLTKDPKEVRASIDSIVGTNGGDEPEAYEYMALAQAQRIPKESAGRKRAVVLVADSTPHGMKDLAIEGSIDYTRAFAAMKTVCDGFYLVGCNPRSYALQQQLIDPTRKEKEQFIPLGDMVNVLPSLLVALARKTESDKALAEYLSLLGKQNPQLAGKVAGLLAAGNEEYR